MAPRRETHPDWWLLTTSLALLFLGVFIVFSASFARAGQASSTGLDMFFYLKRQAMWAVIALGAMCVGMRLPYHLLRPWWLVVTGAAAVLLGAVLIPGLGIEANGSRRWLGMGQVRFQPSEFAKIALVIFLAAYAARRRGSIKDPVHGLGPALVVMGVLGALIAVEDLGTAAAFGFTGMLMLHMAGVKKRHMLVLLAAGGVLFSAFVLHKEYRRERVTAFVNPFSESAYNGAGYQPAQSLIALGSGGWSGKGIGRGRQKFLYLPAEHTDYIFATVGEEMGLVGSLGVLAAFVMLVMRGLTIAHRTRDRFGSLLAAGLTSMIGMQAILNIAVVTSSVPATGVPLPFISYGGSSLVFVMLAVGIILNVSQFPNAVSSENPRRGSNPLLGAKTAPAWEPSLTKSSTPGTRRVARSGAAAPIRTTYRRPQRGSTVTSR